MAFLLETANLEAGSAITEKQDGNQYPIREIIHNSTSLRHDKHRKP